MTHLREVGQCNDEEDLVLFRQQADQDDSCRDSSCHQPRGSRSQWSRSTESGQNGLNLLLNTEISYFFSRIPPFAIRECSTNSRIIIDRYSSTGYPKRVEESRWRSIQRTAKEKCVSHQLDFISHRMHRTDYTINEVSATRDDTNGSPKLIVMERPLPSQRRGGSGTPMSFFVGVDHLLLIRKRFSFLPAMRSMLISRYLLLLARVPSCSFTVNPSFKMKELIDSRRYQDALNLFDQPSAASNEISVNLALKACTKLGHRQRGMQIHQNLSSKSLHNPFIQASLIHFYS